MSDERASAGIVIPALPESSDAYEEVPGAFLASYDANYDRWQKVLQKIPNRSLSTNIDFFIAELQDQYTSPRALCAVFFLQKTLLSYASKVRNMLNNIFTDANTPKLTNTPEPTNTSGEAPKEADFSRLTENTSMLYSSLKELCKITIADIAIALKNTEIKKDQVAQEWYKTTHGLLLQFQEKLQELEQAHLKVVSIFFDQAKKEHANEETDQTSQYDCVKEFFAKLNDCLKEHQIFARKLKEAPTQQSSSDTPEKD